MEAKGTGFEFDFMMVIWPMCAGEESLQWGHLFNAAYSYSRAITTTCARHMNWARPCSSRAQQATKCLFLIRRRRAPEE